MYNNLLVFRLVCLTESGFKGAGSQAVCDESSLLAGRVPALGRRDSVRAAQVFLQYPWEGFSVRPQMFRLFQNPFQRTPKLFGR